MPQETNTIVSSSSRENESREAEYDVRKIWAKGAFKNVYLGKYTEGSRKGEECVVKQYQTGASYGKRAFYPELDAVDLAQEIIDDFQKE